VVSHLKAYIIRSYSGLRAVARNISLKVKFFEVLGLMWYIKALMGCGDSGDS